MFLRERPSPLASPVPGWVYRYHNQITARRDTGNGGRFRKRNLKHAKECSIQQRRGFACGVCRWKRRFGCSRNSAVSAARFESGFRERDGQGQHWRGPHSHGGFLKMIVCESGGHANGLTYFIFRFLRRPQHRPLEVLVASHRPRPRRSPIVSDHTGRGQRRRGIFSTAC